MTGNLSYHEFISHILLIKDEKRKSNSFHWQVFVNNSYGKVMDKKIFIQIQVGWIKVVYILKYITNIFRSHLLNLDLLLQFSLYRETFFNLIFDHF